MNIRPNKEHVYTKRSCLLCKRYPCFQGQSEMECDYAKYVSKIRWQVSERKEKQSQDQIKQNK